MSKFEASLLDLLANTEYESARRLMYTLKTELEYLTDGYKEKEEYLDNINANEIFDDMIKQLINHIDSGADSVKTIIKEVSGSGAIDYETNDGNRNKSRQLSSV